MKLQNYERLTMIIGCNNPNTKTENYFTQEIIETVLQDEHVDGFTINRGSGYWKNEKENNLTLTIINNFTSDEEFKYLIDELYITLKSILEQEEITVIIDNVMCNL